MKNKTKRLGKTFNRSSRTMSNKCFMKFIFSHFSHRELMLVCCFCCLQNSETCYHSVTTLHSMLPAASCHLFHFPPHSKLSVLHLLFLCLKYKHAEFTTKISHLKSTALFGYVLQYNEAECSVEQKVYLLMLD